MMAKTIRLALPLTGTLLLTASPGLWAEEPASGVKPAEPEARAYCEGSAKSMHILAEDLESYTTDCISDYLRDPPGELGVSPERGGTGY